jgi:hypothetical protein
MGQIPNSTSRLLPLSILVVVVVALLAWVLMRSKAADVAAITALSPQQSQLHASADELAPPGQHEEEVATAPSRAKAVAEPKSAPTSAKPDAVQAMFEVRFDLERPDRSEIIAPRAEIDFDLADGTRRHATVTADSHTTMKLPAGACTVNVRVAGFIHREQKVFVEPGADRSDSGPQTERLVLWPTGKEWIAIIVQTIDGRPFSALADDLGLEGRRLFYQAFDVRAYLSAPGPGTPATETEHLATFHPPSGYKNFDHPGGVVGRLELDREPPVWAELRLFGVPLGSEVIHPGDQEVVFHIDQSAYDACCATIRLRVLDAQTRTPLTDARVTLRADNAPHRRQDQENVQPDGAGVVELARVLPGKYELTVFRGDDLDQRRIDLVAKQFLDVGDVLIEQRGHLELLVVDEFDHPQSAWIEIAPYARMKVEDLYPPMLHRLAGSDGKIKLPLPAQRSIVRARVESGTSRGQPASGPRSANMLLDPKALPPEPWRIVLREPISTTFDVGLRDVTSIEVSDELGIVDVWPKVDEKGHAICDLIAGRHHVRYLDADGALRGEKDFTVAKDAAIVRSP